MKVHYHQVDDALYVRLDDSQIIESEEVAPGIIVDYNNEKQITGIEVLGLKKRMPRAKVSELQLEIS